MLFRLLGEEQENTPFTRHYKAVCLCNPQALFSRGGCPYVGCSFCQYPHPVKLLSSSSQKQQFSLVAAYSSFDKYQIRKEISSQYIYFFSILCQDDDDNV